MRAYMYEFPIPSCYNIMSLHRSFSMERIALDPCQTRQADEALGYICILTRYSHHQGDRSLGPV